MSRLDKSTSSGADNDKRSLSMLLKVPGTGVIAHQESVYTAALSHESHHGYHHSSSRPPGCSAKVSTPPLGSTHEDASIDALIDHILAAEQVPTLGESVSSAQVNPEVVHGTGTTSDEHHHRQAMHREETHGGSVAVLAPSNRTSFDRAMKSLYQLVFPKRRANHAPTPQFLVFGFELVLSCVLVAIVLVGRDSIQDATHMNSGLLVGSIGTLAMCSFVIGSYLWSQRYHRHMHILLLQLSWCDFFLALSFVLEPAWNKAGAGVGDGLSCLWLSVIREYLIMCSTVWSICMALDLYYLMTDPFTSPRMNRRNYAIASHAFALLAAIIMGVFNAFDAPVAVGNFCWVGAPSEPQNKASVGNAGVYLFVIAPTSISMVINIYVTLASYRNFRHGIAATLRNRRVLLRQGFWTTVIWIVYSVLVWGLYTGYWVTTSDSASHVLSCLFSFLLSYRGSVTFLLWSLYEHSIELPTPLRASESSTTSSRVEANADPNDDVVRPQMNLALLEELVFYTTNGITRAVQLVNQTPTERATVARASDCSVFTVDPPSKASGSSSARSVITAQQLSAAASTFAAHEMSSSPKKTSFFANDDVKFTDFYPHVFLRLRRHFEIDEHEYLTSLEKCTTPRVSEGASGSFMFYSQDHMYIVKSLTSRESNFLHEILDRYVEYVTTHRDSFLTRFLGSYCIVLYGKKARFVVMENVFDIQHGVSIHQRYDIKGSWIDRNAQKPHKGAEATCRHCNMMFRCGGRDVCPNRAGSHEANVVLKDMDLTTKLRFGKDQGRRLLTQLKHDSDFLCDLGVMDYSLLLGVIEVSYKVNPQNILTRDGSLFMPRFMQDLRETTMARNSTMMYGNGTGGVTAAHGNDSTGNEQLLTPASDDFADRTNSTVSPPNKNQRRSMKQSGMCMRTSEVVVGPGFYYIGIIDILQTWTISKRFERFVKSFILRKDPDGLSAMAPKPYRVRFHKKLEEIIHLGHDTPDSNGSEVSFDASAAENLPGGKAIEQAEQDRSSS